MRKKFSLLGLAICSMMALTACGSEENFVIPTTTPVVEEVTSETEEVTSETGEEAVTGASESVSEEDFVKVGEFETEKGTVVATVTCDTEGNPIDIHFDNITKEGESQYEKAVAGEYVMAEGSTPWHEQVDTLSKFIKENNFDLTKVVFVDDVGHVDAVTGVSIKVSAFIEAAKIALAK